jgi:acetyl-CoA carboxylase biotin carboxyl carrier protein
VRVGSRVNVGQTLCIIEAMKIMNPIDAEISGVIREVCVQDAQPVEFGQVLFRVDPNG